MRYSCQTTTKASIVNLYHESEIIASSSVYFNIVICPKIFLTQHVCKLCEKNKVRVTLKILNYEARCFRNLRLIYTIFPNPITYRILKSDGEINQENNILSIDFITVPPLSIQTVELEVELLSNGKFTSQAFLKEVFCGKLCDEVIKSSICDRLF